MSYKYIDPSTHNKIARDTRTYKEIAEDYGVHKDTVGRIKRQHLHDSIVNTTHREHADNGTSTIQESRTITVKR